MQTQRRPRICVWSVSLVLMVAMLLPTIAFAKTTITYWHPWGGRWGEKQVEIVHAFNQAQSDLEVEVVQIPGDQIVQKLITASISGTAPDVVTIWGGLDPVVYPDYALSLDDFFVRDTAMKRDDWLPGALEYNSYENTLYALPWVGAAFGLYYNKDVFREVGLDPDTAPKTWDDMDAYAQKTTKRGSRGFERLGFVPWSWGASGVVTHAWQSGGSWWNSETQELNFTDMANLRAVEWMKSYADQYGIEAVEEFGSGNDPDPFASGRYAMQVEGPWMISAHREYGPDVDFGVSEIPYPKDGQPASYFYTDSMFIPAASKNHSDAWEFLKWMATEGNGIWSRWAAELVVRKDQVDAPEFDDPLYQAYVKFTEDNQVVNIPVRRFFLSEIDAALEYVLYGKKGIEEAFRDAESSVERELRQKLRRR